MPYKITWLLENRLIYVYSYGVMDTSEMQKMFLNIGQLLAEGGQAPMDVITDGTDVQKTDVSAAQLRQIFQKPSSVPLRWTLSVNPSLISRFFASLIFQFMGIRGRSVASVPEALAFLAEHDPTFPSETLSIWENWLAEHREPLSVD